MHSVEPRTVYIVYCIRKINAVKHGTWRPRNIVPVFSLLFAAVSINHFVHWLPLHPRGSMRTCRAQETTWPAMHTFLSVALEHAIVRLHVAHEIIAFSSATHIHTYIQTVCRRGIICLALRHSTSRKPSQSHHFIFDSS